MSYTNGLDKPTDYFNTVLYTGNGSSQTITGVGFAGDWFWFKERSTSGNHQQLDRVRSSFTKNLTSNRSDAEGTTSTYITSVNSDGFAVGTNNGINQDGVTNVAWCWLADNTTGSSNTNGSINSTVSVNTTAGFSICSWTHDGGNSTIGHGLGAIPQVIITKERNNSGSWNSYFSAVGNGYRMVLQGTNAKISSSIWNSTTPTANVFSMNDNVTSTMIAYCFTEKKGYSKFGGYTGNGNADGAFVYTGFKPAFLMIKNSSTGSTKWTICDNKRDGFNANNHRLFASETDAESTSNPWEMYSNGFKITTTGSFVNTDGDNYFYMAFAEAPFVNSNGVPTTAR